MYVLNKYRYKHGFTLIELMVVISIISLLSSIITVFLSDARERARFAAAKASYRHTQNILYEKTAYRFNFDDNNFNSTDSINNGVSATNPSQSINPALLLSDTTLFDKGYSLYVPSSIDITNDGLTYYNTKVGDIVNDFDYILSTWFRPTVLNTNGQKPILSVSPDGNSLGNKIYLNNSNFLCAQIYSGGPYFCTDYKFVINRWYYITAMYKRLNTNDLEIRLTVDGKTFSNVFTGVTNQTSYRSIVIGADCCSNAVGYFDEVMLIDATY